MMLFSSAQLIGGARSCDSATYAGNESGLNVLLYAILIVSSEDKENEVCGAKSGFMTIRCTELRVSNPGEPRAKLECGVGLTARLIRPSSPLRRQCKDGLVVICEIQLRMLQAQANQPASVTVC